LVESFDDSDNDVVIADGTLSFDSNGNIAAGTAGTISIDRNSTAAVSPMQVSIDFSGVSGISSAAAGSTLSLSSQDGSAPGTLTNFVIDETGVINGLFDNGVIRTLGQVTLARFANPQGLLEAGSGAFREGVSSGPPFLATPGNFGAGTVRAGAIELSNTDIGRDLVNLIVASTNYRGNARVISSVQQLVDELLILGR
jgi:flagellar hook protein FlgE